LTGGVVQYNPLIVELIQEQLGSEIVVKVPPKPQIIGALGAALIAIDNYNSN
jgi:activator of 2-hydroxyglutaryl-CoA dehydratase